MHQDPVGPWRTKIGKLSEIAAERRRFARLDLGRKRERLHVVYVQLGLLIAGGLGLRLGDLGVKETEQRRTKGDAEPRGRLGMDPVLPPMGVILGVVGQQQRLDVVQAGVDDHQVGVERQHAVQERREDLEAGRVRDARVHDLDMGVARLGSEKIAELGRISLLGAVDRGSVRLGYPQTNDAKDALGLGDGHFGRAEPQLIVLSLPLVSALGIERDQRVRMR